MDLLHLVRGSTFDDFLFTPQEGLLLRRDPSTVDLSTRFSEHVMIKRPLVSANMDTVTRAAMAVVLAEEGGIGVSIADFGRATSSPRLRKSQR